MPRAPIKRTKTYTGCWTCRDRGVKCDLAKPHCVRCTRSRRVCAGYGIRLSWVCGQQRAADHRRLVAAPTRNNPVFDDDHIRTALEDLDLPDDACDMQIAPFGVFRPEPSSPLAGVKLRVMPLLQPFLASASVQERKLFRHWVSYLSGVFVATPCSDNPFRTIYIPLALASSESDAHASLLRCIYAATAFHYAHQQDCREYYAIAVEHHEMSLRHLRRSMAESREGQHEAVLAAIILMTSTEAIAGNHSTWRIHVRGGREWLHAQKSSSWMESSNARTLLQIFECVELIGGLHCGGGGRQLRPSASMEAGGYRLDRFFAIPEPLFRALDGMNRLRWPGSCRLPGCQLESIEARILAAKPDTSPLRKDSPSVAEERLATHHALLFYYACRIYLQREFYQAPPSRVQALVRKCLHHLEAIQAIERTVDACGLLWPTFVAACEAEDTDVRERLLRLFDKGGRLGIGNITQAAKLVQELWRHRDQGGQDAADDRHELIELLGFDLLLT